MTRRYAPQLVCLLCGLPFLRCASSFARLWFFGDDWDQLSEMARMGLLPWLFHPFAENFVPLFKLTWAGAIYIFDGSYFGLMALLWAVHILNLLLFAKVLARFQIPTLAIVGAVLSAGLPWTNIETLAWSIQLSGLLSTTVYFLAWLYMERRPLLFACLAAAPLFHSRGVLNGIAMAAGLLLSRPRTRAQTRLAVASLAISAGMAALIYILALRHNPAPSNTLVHTAAFALHYLALNPLLDIMRLPAQHIAWSVVACLGILKAVIVIRGYLVSPHPVRPFLLAALVMDVGYAAMLSIGRVRFGLDIAVSWRYQYLSWFCFAPFLALAADDLLARIPMPAPKWIPAAALLAAWTVFLARPWQHEMVEWSQWRGSETRQIVRTAMPETLVRVISVGRARELEQRYHLH